MKKNLPLLILTAVFLGVLIFSLIHISGNQKHPVEFFKGQSNVGYEVAPDFAQVEQSPAGAWADTPDGFKIVGWLMIAVFLLSVFTIAKGFTAKDKNNVRTALMFLIPFILALMLFLLPYSDRLAGQYRSVDRGTFDTWVNDGQVIKKGEKTYTGQQLDLLFSKAK